MYGYRVILVVLESVAKDLPVDLFGLAETDPAVNGVAVIERRGANLATLLDKQLDKLNDYAETNNFAYKLWVLGDEDTHIEYYFNFTGDEEKDAKIDAYKLQRRVVLCG